MEEFEAGLKEIIAKVKDAGGRVILCTPSVIGEKTDGTNKQDKMLAEYAEVPYRAALAAGVPAY